MKVAFLLQVTYKQTLGRHSASWGEGHFFFLSCTVQLRNDAWCWEDDNVHEREEIGEEIKHELN